MAVVGEPRCRERAFIAAQGYKLLLWGGRGEFDGGEIREVSCDEVHRFDPATESWSVLQTRGQHPPNGVFDGACAISGHFAYSYGGLIDGGSNEHGSLYQLDLLTNQWKELSPCIQGGPLGKYGCGLVVRGEEVVIFGGSSHMLPFSLVAHLYSKSGSWCVNGRMTNELHVFNLKTGE